VQNRLLYNYHLQKNKQEDNRRFRLFMLVQVINYGALLVLFFGGLFFIVIALKAFFA